MSVNLLASEIHTPCVLGGEVRTSHLDHHQMARPSRDTSPGLEIDFDSTHGLL